MLAFGLTEPDAGSDAAALKTTAVECEGGYILNGRKCFITNAPYAKLFVIFAKTQKGIGSKGISAFIVEGDRPGVSTGRHEDKMGLRLSAAGDVILENVFVPKENLLGEPGQGFKIAMKTLDASRVEVGAASRKARSITAWITPRAVSALVHPLPSCRRFSSCWRTCRSRRRQHVRWSMVQQRWWITTSARTPRFARRQNASPVMLQ